MLYTLAVSYENGLLRVMPGEETGEGEAWGGMEPGEGGALRESGDAQR